MLPTLLPMRLPAKVEAISLLAGRAGHPAKHSRARVYESVGKKLADPAKFSASRDARIATLNLPSGAASCNHHDDRCALYTPGEARGRVWL